MERDYLDDLKSILNSDIPDSEKKVKILQYHESDIADLLNELDDDETKKLYEILGDENIADVWTHADDIEEIIEDIPAEKIADIIETMDADDAIDVLEELDEEKRDEIVKLLEPEAKEEISAIARYDEDQIGPIPAVSTVAVLS